MKVMGTGSRQMVVDPNRVKMYEKLRTMVLAMRDIDPELVLISGLAEGFDEAIAKIGMREGIPYIAAIPNPTYGNYYWRDHSLTKRNRLATFRELVANSEEAVFVCDSVYQYGIHSNFIRNDWMIKECDFALCYDAGSSGTRDAIKKLHAVDKKIVYLTPPF